MTWGIIFTLCWFAYLVKEHGTFPSTLIFLVICLKWKVNMCLWAYKCVCVQSFLYRDLLSLNLFCTRGLSQKISVFLLYYCAIVIYHKKYIWSLSPFPRTELPRPLEFPQWGDQQKCLCYVNKVTFGTHLRVRTDCQENRGRIQGWNFQSHPQVSRKGGEAGGWNNNQWPMT